MLCLSIQSLFAEIFHIRNATLRFHSSRTRDSFRISTSRDFPIVICVKSSLLTQVLLSKCRMPTLDFSHHPSDGGNLALLLTLYWHTVLRPAMPNMSLFYKLLSLAKQPRQKTL